MDKQLILDICEGKSNLSVAELSDKSQDFLLRLCTVLISRGYEHSFLKKSFKLITENKISLLKRNFALLNKKTLAKSRTAITITFGDQAENHAGMQIIGKKAEHGFSIDELQRAKILFESQGCICEYIDLKERLLNTWDNPNNINIAEASVLLIRDGVSHMLREVEFNSDDMFEEQAHLNLDTKAFMRGRVVNKNARYNVCFDEIEQEPDYDNKKGRLIKYDDVPLTKYLRYSFPKYFGKSAEKLAGEGNYYYDIQICGIGWHGDTERKKVIAVRLGSSIPLAYQWFYRNKIIGKRIDIPKIKHGDIYIMSEKASGFDWKSSSFATLRHSAGCEKFLAYKPEWLR
jgi:hypothetical protein